MFGLIDKLQKWSFTLILPSVVLMTSGCSLTRCGSMFDECIERCLTNKRARHQAADCWDQHPNRCASAYVRDGFIDGYVDVAMGRRGCTPAVAPSRYWGWQFSPAEGQVAGGQWLAGYPIGVAAAKANGVRTYAPSLNIPSKEQYKAQGIYSGEGEVVYEVDVTPGPDTIDDTIPFTPRDTELTPESVDPEPLPVNDLESESSSSQVPDRIPVKPVSQSIDVFEEIFEEPAAQVSKPPVTSQSDEPAVEDGMLPIPSEQPATDEALLKKTFVKKAFPANPFATKAPAESPFASKATAAKADAAKPAVIPAEKQSGVNSAIQKPASKSAMQKPEAGKTPSKVSAKSKTKTGTPEQSGGILPEFKLEMNDEVFGFGID